MRARIGLAAGLLVALGTVGQAQGQVEKQQVVDSIKKAFTTWENVSCSSLKFSFPTPLTAFEPYKANAILVYFGYDALTWIHGNNAYFTTAQHELTEKGNLNKGVIALNARDFGWSIGAAANKIDIETAVLHLIPSVVGFYVGTDPLGQSSNFVAFNKEDRTLTPLHEQGARFSYFEAGSTACVQPEMPHVCGEAAQPATDAGVSDGQAAPIDAGAMDQSSGATTDAGLPNQLCIMHSSPNDKTKGKPLHWETQPVQVYIYVHDTYGNLPGGAPAPTGDGGTARQDAGTSPTADAGGAGAPCSATAKCATGFVCSAEGRCVATAPGTDDGCSCSVDAPGSGSASLLLMGFLLFAWSRHRRANGRRRDV